MSKFKPSLVFARSDDFAKNLRKQNKKERKSKMKISLCFSSPICKMGPTTTWFLEYLSGWKSNTRKPLGGSFAHLEVLQALGIPLTLSLQHSEHLCIWRFTWIVIVLISRTLRFDLHLRALYLCFLFCNPFCSFSLRIKNASSMSVMFLALLYCSIDSAPLQNRLFQSYYSHLTLWILPWLLFFCYISFC